MIDPANAASREALIEATQGDRDAAAPLLYLNEPTSAALILKGKRDNHPTVQAFARYRLALADEAASQPREGVGSLACSGCGSTQTIDEIRADHPGALSCCPERKMIGPARRAVDQWCKEWLADAGSHWGDVIAWDTARKIADRLDTAPTDQAQGGGEQ